jgi:hypothetical protein
MTSLDRNWRVLVLAVLVTIACQSSTQATADRLWQRRKDCSEAAEREARREGLTGGFRNGAFESHGYGNHYSIKYDQCFVLGRYWDVEYQGPQGDRPLQHELLFEAFENRYLSTCTSDPAWRTMRTARGKSYQGTEYCEIDGDADKVGDCDACSQFIKDRMEN